MVVPIYFAPAGIELGTLRLEAGFVSRNLKFVKFTRGSAAESAETQLTSDAAEVKDEQGLEHTTLTLTAQAAGKAKTIPGGLLGYLSFKVSDRAGPAIISFRTTVAATLADASSRPQAVEVLTDQVEIIAEGSEPLISCFFFSH